MERLTTTSPAVEQQRVAAHLQRAESLAASRDVSALDPLRLLVRELLLTELATYRATGRFPKNPGFAELTPTFVDTEGTRCAVAHLLEVGGEKTLVSEIASARNHAYVRELAADPRLVAWLDAAGLTVEEAALIQPGYSCTPPVSCVCGEGFGASASMPVPATAVLQAVVVDDATARVLQSFGTSTLKPGDLFAFQNGTVGAKLIIGLDRMQAMSVVAGNGGTTNLGYLPSLPLDSAEKFTCLPGLGGGPSAPALTAEEYARIVLATDCKAEARKVPGFEANACSSGGCTTSAGGPVSSLGILLALVGVLMARRLR